MATQASAITFLSTPGQAYEDGMRFVQFYFGLPLAMVVLSAVFVPLYYRLRGLHRLRVPGAPLRSARRASSARSCSCSSAGWPPASPSTRPAIILSKVLGWPLNVDQRGHRRAGDPLHRRGGTTRGQPDAEAPDGGDAGRDGGRVRRDRLAAARPSCRSATRCRLAGALGQDERRRLLAAISAAATPSGRASPAASSWRCRTSAPTSRRCSATCRAARSPRAGWGCCSTACSRSRCSCSSCSSA